MPGVLNWYRSEVERHATYWHDEALPRVMSEVAPYIQPRLARVWMVKGWRFRRTAFTQARATSVPTHHTPGPQLGSPHHTVVEH